MKQEIKDGAAPVEATSAGADAPGPLRPPFRVFKHEDSLGWCVKDAHDQGIYPIVRREEEEAAAHQIADALNAASSPSPEPAEAAPAPAEVITEDGIKSAQVVWRGDAREISEIAVVDNRIIGRAESNLPWTTLGTLPAPLPGVEGVTGAPDPGPLPLEVPNVNLVAWEDGEKVITVGGKVVGCTLTEQDGRIIQDWLDTAIREIWEMRALDHEDFPAHQLRARLIQRINENTFLLEQLESIHRLWLDWRENGMANAITKAGEYMHKIGKVVDPSYPADRLRPRIEAPAPIYADPVAGPRRWHPAKCTACNWTGFARFRGDNLTPIPGEDDSDFDCPGCRAAVDLTDGPVPIPPAPDPFPAHKEAAPAGAEKELIAALKVILNLAEHGAPHADGDQALFDLLDKIVDGARAALTKAQGSR